MKKNEVRSLRMTFSDGYTITISGEFLDDLRRDPEIDLVEWLYQRREAAYQKHGIGTAHE